MTLSMHNRSRSSEPVPVSSIINVHTTQPAHTIPNVESDASSSSDGTDANMDVGFLTEEELEPEPEIVPDIVTPHLQQQVPPEVQIQARLQPQHQPRLRIRPARIQRHRGQFLNMGD